MVNYAGAFSQSESGKYFECIIEINKSTVNLTSLLHDHYF